MEWSSSDFLLPNQRLVVPDLPIVSVMSPGFLCSSVAGLGSEHEAHVSEKVKLLNSSLILMAHPHTLASLP